MRHVSYGEQSPHILLPNDFEFSCAVQRILIREQGISRHFVQCKDGSETQCWTEKENRIFGEYRDDLADRTREMAREGIDKAKQVATAATAAAREEVRHATSQDSTGQGRAGTASRTDTPGPIPSSSV